MLQSSPASSCSSKEYSIPFPEQVYKVETITWNVKPNQCIFAYQPLGRLIYTSYQGIKEVLTIVSDQSGCVQKLLITTEKSSSITGGSSSITGSSSSITGGSSSRILLTISCCNHCETIHGLCLLCSGDCSSSINVTKFTYERGATFNLPIIIPSSSSTTSTSTTTATTTTTTTTSILLPEIVKSHFGYTTSYEKGVERDRVNQQRLFELKKLSLVLDLDHTLLHTINNQKVPYFNDIYNNSKDLQKDIHKFFMRGFYHFVKFRPNLESFLEKCSEIYELHIFTHGDRGYADQIGKMLDKSKSLFAERILSRDECPDTNTKTLNHIFPYSDKSVLVVDDRTDVWKDNIDNVIQIAPYDYFSTNHKRNTINNIDHIIDDQDDHLDTIFDILKKVHSNYFNSSLRNVKIILKETKKEILKGVHIVFSGVIPLKQKQQNESHPDWRIATDLGAKCYSDIVPYMTHMVARHKGTEKVKKAEQMPGVHVVDLSWLHACLKYLKKQKEENYFLSDYKPFNSTSSLIEGFYNNSYREEMNFQSVCDIDFDMVQKESVLEEEIEMNLESDSDDSFDDDDNSSSSDMDF